MSVDRDSPWSVGRAEDLGLDVLAAMVRDAADGVIVLDGDHRIVYANPVACERLGYPLDRLRGQDRVAFLPEEERHTYLTFLDKARSGKSEAWTVISHPPDGSELEVDLTATAHDVQGKQFLVTAGRDVTQRHRQARQAAALAHAAASVAVSESIHATVEAIAECALGGTRALAAWVTLDDEHQVAAWVGAAGVPVEFRERLRPAAWTTATCSVFVEALLAQRVLVCADARHRMEREFETKGVVDALRSLPWQTAAFAPILHQGGVVGVLTAIYRAEEMPYEAETTFLAALADQAAMAAANARLLAAERERVALKERQRLARELHDSISQSLYAIQLGAQMARERLDGDPGGIAQPIDYVMRLAEASQAEMRALIFELRPETLEEEGLVAALNRQIEVVRARHGIIAETIASEEPELPIDVKGALHRIAQEALWNTVRHAHARRVDVNLEARSGSLGMEIADDGIGFDPNTSFPGHLGLRSMRERALGVGGSLEVVSSGGRGTRIVVRVPAARPSPARGECLSRSSRDRTRRVG